MIRVVFDTSVVISAIFWPRSTARRALALAARRRIRLCVTEPIEKEYLETALELQRTRFSDRDPRPLLDWIRVKAIHCVPAPLGKRVSRDRNDDPFLACALAAQAKYIASSDKDLLALEKPFGIAIVTPIELISTVREMP